MGHKTIRGARLLGQIAESRVQLAILYSVVGVLWVVVVCYMQLAEPRVESPSFGGIWSHPPAQPPFHLSWN